MLPIEILINVSTANMDNMQSTFELSTTNRVEHRLIFGSTRYPFLVAKGFHPDVLVSGTLDRKTAADRPLPQSFHGLTKQVSLLPGNFVGIRSMSALGCATCFRLLHEFVTERDEV